MWVRGVVCHSTQTQTLTVVACVILQCIPCFNKCRCMSGFFFPLPSGLCSVDWVRPHHSSRGCCRPLFGSHGRARFLRHSRARCSPAAAGVQKAQQLRFLWLFHLQLLPTAPPQRPPAPVRCLRGTLVRCHAKSVAWTNCMISPGFI